MTLIIIAITAFASILAFSREDLMDKLQFNASKVVHKREYYRLVSHGFVHANWEHLIVNMIVLFSFGRVIEAYFEYGFGRMATAYYLILYFGGMIVSNLYAIYKHRNNFYYNAVGASGAVSAVLFAAIFFEPWNKIYFFGVLPIPGIVFALLYLAYSYYMGRKQNDNVAHDAHFLGAVFGFIFPILLNSSLFQRFMDKLFMVI
ncbi:rhomboid family intramembrane serine protease [uncultured Sunxiuqinia sp.]|uniref:rhomboid family intramembrane serine protease n=1 Tax=uncultured Sunxiuqinia sp. TaxID=1573825 RepID=UPI0026209C94|nr:rhomboid family intramembrane serine protease [uncultured Sunxiuqinia sp.]